MYDPYELNLDVVRISNNIALIRSPYHEDANPSAIFDMLTGHFYDFALGISKNVWALASYTMGKVVRTNNIQQLTKTYSDFYDELIDKSKLALGNKYLYKRLVTDEQIEKHDIREFKKGVLFLLKNRNGKVTCLHYRKYTGSPKYITIGEKPPVWLDYQNLDYSKELILTEGVFGALRGELYGFQTGAVIGAMIKDDIRFWLQDHTKVKGIFDNDEAGVIASLRLLKSLPLSSVVLPGDEMDELDKGGWEVKVNSSSIRNVFEVMKTLDKIREKQ